MDEESQLDESEDGADFWDDPREKPRTGATLIRKRHTRLNIEVIPPLLMQFAGMFKADATQACGREGGILVDNIPIPAAEALAEALKAAGEDCFVVPAAHVVPLPPERQVHAAHLGKSEVTLSDAAGHADTAPWNKVIVFTMAHVRVSKTETRAVPGNPLTRRITYVGFSGVAGVAAGAAMAGGPAHKTVTNSSTRTYLDIVFVGGLRRHRIDAREFDYEILGDQRQTGSEANAHTLARWLLYAAPHLRTNFDTSKLMTSGELDIPVHSEHGFEDITHWLINLARFED